LAQKNRITNWSDFQFVIAVARLGSFQAASIFLETNQSTVGRRVQRLEQLLGTKIFDRYANGMQLTPAGRILFDNALSMEAAAGQIEANLSGLDATLIGTIKISATEGLGYLWLAGVLAEFSARYSDIDIDIITDRQGLNLLHRDADISIVIERPKDPRLVVSKVAQLGHSLFMASTYEAQHGRPGGWEEFAAHRFIDYAPYHVSAGLSWWTDTVLPANRVSFRSDSASIYLSALRAGVGIGLLPNFYRSAAPDLIQLPIETGCSLSIWLVSHEETNQARRTRLLLEFLKQRFNQDRMSWFRS
jgi:DNA-binding transcriptional LysR family regulator